MLTASAASEPRVWALLGARPGDNDQVIALAEAAGLAAEFKQLEYNGLRWLGPRFLGRSLASLTRNSRKAVLDGPLPDVTISTGHRSVPIVRAVRELSGGHLRSIHVGFPRVSPGNFDLVIATPQYPIADHARLLRIPYALTRAATPPSNDADLESLLTLPGPRRLLVVGGSNIYWKIDEKRLLQTVQQLLEGARKEGGSVLVTTSPRTPRALTERIARQLAGTNIPTLLATPGKPPSYSSLLEASDTIHVTADSVSMISDGIWTGKPIALVPVVPNALGRLVIGAMTCLGRTSKSLHPQDLRPFWSALEAMGITERLGIPTMSVPEVKAMVLSRVRAILPT